MKKCRCCGKETDDLSRRGLCIDCGNARMVEAIRQMKEKKGPVYTYWLKMTQNPRRGVKT